MAGKKGCEPASIVGGASGSEAICDMVIFLILVIINMDTKVHYLQTCVSLVLKKLLIITNHCLVMFIYVSWMPQKPLIV